jgi:hypothetical protein
MKKILLAALAVIGGGSALAEIRAPELAVETTAGSIVLPSKPPSSIALAPCRGCTPMLVHTTERSLYYLNGQVVGLEELRRALAGHPNAFVVVIYDRKSGELRRLRASVR